MGLGRRNLGTAPKWGWAPGENRYRATPTRAGRVAPAWTQVRMGKAQEIGRVAPAWQMVSCVYWYLV